MLEGWYAGTREDGPHDGDVAVLERYLGRVVLEERDMDKAKSLARMMHDIVAADAGHRGHDADPDLCRGTELGQSAWADALGRIKSAVQNAVKARGLGPIRI